VKIRELRFESDIQAPRERVFAFFAEPSNLMRLTPPWIRVHWAGAPPSRMGEGQRLAYWVWLHGIPLPWRGHIRAWDPPRLFADVQDLGPYRRWDHEHRFEETATGTRVVDAVRYAVWGGECMDRWVVRPELERMFAFRRVALEQAMRGGA
jgi:hypothetical protein